MRVAILTTELMGDGGAARSATCWPAIDSRKVIFDIVTCDGRLAHLEHQNQKRARPRLRHSGA
jgi:hypothetical protein